MVTNVSQNGSVQCLQAFPTHKCVVCCFLWNWNLKYKHAYKFMILSNFAHLTMSSSFQSNFCSLLDLFSIYLKAGIWMSERPLETLMSWNSKKNFKIEVLVNWSLLDTLRQHQKGCCWSESLFSPCLPVLVAVVLRDWSLHDFIGGNNLSNEEVVLGKFP